MRPKQHLNASHEHQDWIEHPNDLLPIAERFDWGLKSACSNSVSHGSSVLSRSLTIEEWSSELMNHGDKPPFNPQPRGLAEGGQRCREGRRSIETKWALNGLPAAAARSLMPRRGENRLGGNNRWPASRLLVARGGHGEPTTTPVPTASGCPQSADPTRHQAQTLTDPDTRRHTCRRPMRQRRAGIPQWPATSRRNRPLKSHDKRGSRQSQTPL